MPKKDLKDKTIITLITLPNDEPVHIPLSFEQAMKKAVNTPIKKSKANRPK